MTVSLTSMHHRRLLLGIALVALAGCSSGGGDSPLLATATTSTTIATPTTTAATATTRAGASTTAAAPSTTRGTTSSTGLTSIEVASTTSQYFVLYVKPSLNAALEIPVAIAKGKAGSTTLSDGRTQLPKEHYRVATFSVDKPGDVDGDGIDDLTELADPLGSPLNPAPKQTARNGAIFIPTVETFADLSYQGNDVAQDQYLAGLEFMKFWIVGTNTDHPAVYFMNTNTWKAHPQFASAIGLVGAGRGPGSTPGSMRGDIVYNPNGIAPDGSKGTYKFEFQPSDAYSFSEIAIAYEVLVANMPMLRNNLLYYPFPQSALPLYRKEKAQYDAYRVPVLVE